MTFPLPVSDVCSHVHSKQIQAPCNKELSTWKHDPQREMTEDTITWPHVQLSASVNTR